MMVLLTVVGEGLVLPGYTFVYLGPLAECKECKVKNVCFGLVKGKRYRVVSPRKVKHACKVHDGGVQVVEVEEVPFDVCVPEKGLVAGSSITLQMADCRHLGCPSRGLCFPLGIDRGAKLQVIEVGDKVDCAARESRRKARVL
jgi:hypothetical protein